jgi:hypothetical protein
MLHFVSNEVAALVQVIMIDLVLTGDNAIVIGLAAAGLPLQQRTNAVLVGIIACDGPTDNISLNHHPAVAGGGASACGGHSPALGELESFVNCGSPRKGMTTQSNQRLISISILTG